MGNFWLDLRYGLRSLFKARSVTVIAVLALTVGIGATTAIFSVVQAVLLQSLPFREQDRLVVGWKRDAPSGNDFVELSYAEFLDWRAQNRVFEDLAAMPTTVYGYGYTLTGAGEPFQIESAKVTPNFFTLLGANAAAGHVFTEAENQATSSRVVVLNHRLWRDRFGADPRIVGKLITLNGAGYQVVGVMPQEFDFPKGADLWTPLVMDEREQTNRSIIFLQAVGRLRPGATQEQALAELNTIISRVAREHPETQAGGQSAVLTPLAHHIFGSARPALYLLLAASCLLLLIACANITNLLLARAATRRREIAIRAALGASRGRVVRQLLTESLLLAAGGGVLGLLLANLLASVLVKVAPADIPRLDEVEVSGQVLLFTVLVTLLTTILFGLAPAFTTSNVDLNESLREGGAKMAGGRGGGLRHAVVVAEVAITVVLLIGAGLVLRTFMNLRRADLGFDPRNVLTMQLNLQGPRYAKVDRRRDFYSQLVERLEAQPGAAAAGVILIRPLEGPIGWDMPYITEGQSAEDAKRNPVPNYEVITPGYFRAMGIRLIAGREFTEEDREATPQVAVISESMARRVFPPRADPLGQRLRLDPSDPETPWRTVVGVVADARYRQLGDARMDVYVPHRQSADPVRYLIIRTTADPLAFAPVVRREVAALDPNLAVTSLLTGEQLVSRAIARPRFNTLLLACLGVVATLLALIGIYGIVAYMVTQRTREIGIRIALGAQTRDVLKLILWQGMTLVLLGAAAGLVAAFAATRVVSSLLYGVSATDPLTFAGVPLLLIVVALVACLFPTFRAMKVDPLVVLRYE